MTWLQVFDLNWCIYEYKAYNPHFKVSLKSPRQGPPTSILIALENSQGKCEQTTNDGHPMISIAHRLAKVRLKRMSPSASHYKEEQRQWKEEVYKELSVQTSYLDRKNIYFMDHNEA